MKPVLTSSMTHVYQHCTKTKIVINSPFRKGHQNILKLSYGWIIHSMNYLHYMEKYVIYQGCIIMVATKTK